MMIKKEEPLLTVAVITYNQERYVAQAMDGILRQQTDFPIEVLVSDDASTDGTVEILRQYESAYPGIFRMTYRKRNVGATANSYGNYASARGKYIASLEGDDYWIDPCYLQKGARFLEDHDDYIAVAYRSRIIDENGAAVDTNGIEKTKRFWEFEKAVYTAEDFLQWKMPGQISAVIFRNIFRGMPQEESRLLYQLDRIVGDRTLMMFLTGRGRIRCMDEVTSAYRFATSRQGTGYMAQLSNQNGRLNEYAFMCRIEKAAKAHYNGEWSLLQAKKNKLVGAVSTLYRDRTKENAKVVKGILRLGDCFWRDTLLVVRVWVFRAYCRYIIKEERRFPV